MEISCKPLPELQASQSSQFRELQVSLASVTKQLADLKNDNLLLRNEVSSLAARIAILEADHTVPVNDDLPSKVLREISERSSCDLSVIAYEVPESSSSSPSQRIIDDTTELSNALSSINTTLPVDIKVVRLGGHHSKKPRPLKLIFKSKDEAANILLNSDNQSEMVVISQIISVWFGIKHLWNVNFFAHPMLSLNVESSLVN